MIYLFSSEPATIESFFKKKGLSYELVDKEKYGVFLQTYIPQPGDFGIVYDFGKIIPDSLLQNLLLINIHFSLLPKYRGAVPVEAAILAGEKVTGITLQKMAKGMDEGDILFQAPFEIQAHWSAGELQANMDAYLPTLLEKLFLTSPAEWKYIPQKGEPSYCYIKWLNRENGKLDFATMTATEILQKIKAYNPEPLAWVEVTRTGKTVNMNLLRAEVYEGALLAPKEMSFIKKKGLAIGTKDGAVLLTHLVLSGSKPLLGGDIVALKGSLILS